MQTVGKKQFAVEMKIIGNFKDLLQDSTGKGIVSFLVSNFSHKNQLATLEHDKTYSIEIKEIKSKRSIEQNRYMWALLHEIDVAMNGERSNDEWSVYIQCLERAGAKFDYIGCLPEAEQALRENFRAVKFIKKIDLNGKDGNMYKVFIGSSKMNVQEMNMLIETALDMAHEVGINTSYYDEVLR